MTAPDVDALRAAIHATRGRAEAAKGMRPDEWVIDGVGRLVWAFIEAQSPAHVIAGCDADEELLGWVTEYAKSPFRTGLTALLANLARRYALSLSKGHSDTGDDPS